MKDLKFTQLVEESKTILIIGSRRLDWDCIGSGLLLKKYLETLNKTVSFMFPRELSKEEKESYSFLPYFNEVVDQDTREILSKKNFDLLILIDGMRLTQFYDFNSSDRNLPDLKIYDKRVLIDHHTVDPDEGLATHVIRDPKASSIAEILINQVISETATNKEMATLAYTAIVGDTGNFKWNFTSATLEATSLLLKEGADYLVVLDHFFSNPKSYFQVLGVTISQLEFLDDLRTVVFSLSQQKIFELNLDKGKIDEIDRAFKEDLAKRIKGYDRGFLLYEMSPGKIHISARGNDLHNKINMPQLLSKLGGVYGGHFNSCATDLEGNFEEIKQKLLVLLKKYTKA